jgi:hypothetical protein
MPACHLAVLMLACHVATLMPAYQFATLMLVCHLATLMPAYRLATFMGSWLLVILIHSCLPVILLSLCLPLPQDSKSCLSVCLLEFLCLPVILRRSYLSIILRTSCLPGLLAILLPTYHIATILSAYPIAAILSSACQLANLLSAFYSILRPHPTIPYISKPGEKTIFLPSLMSFFSLCDFAWLLGDGGGGVGEPIRTTAIKCGLLYIFFFHDVAHSSANSFQKH